MIQAHESGKRSASQMENENTTIPYSGDRKLHAGLFFPCALLIALNLITFHRTLNGYFLADDLVHVSYLSKVFSGHPELLLQNFYSNWMQAQGTEFYRPIISLTLAFDYLLWGSSAIGFHISNVAFQTLSSIFLFLTVKRLFPETSEGERTLAAVLCAALFACHPLHPEVVSWIIGRVDSVTTMFLFASFWLYLKATQSESNKTARYTLTASLFSFALALMSKEMAITLPPALFLYEMLAGNAQSASPPAGIRGRVKQSFLKVKDYFLVLALYLGGRALALGTVKGGYAGSIGEGLNDTLIKRWFLDGSLLRVIFPFNDEIFGGQERIRHSVKWLYLASLCLFGLRYWAALKEGGSDRQLTLPIKKLFFAFGWLLISLAPTVQVWNLTTSLQGSRFVYMATAPLCLLLAWLLFPGAPCLNEKRRRAIVRFTATMVAALSLTGVYMIIAQKNTAPWAKAMRSVKALRRALESESASLPPERKMVLLNLPQRYKGAHMLYNAATFAILLKPPLSRTDFSERVLTLEPITYGDSGLLNSARFRRLLADKEHYAVYRWNEKTDELAPIEYQEPAEPASMAVPPAIIPLRGLGKPISLKDDEFLASPELLLDATRYDIIDVDATVMPGDGDWQNGEGGAATWLMLGWRGADRSTFSPENQLALAAKIGQRHTYRFFVSERKSWMATPLIGRLKIETMRRPARLIVYSVKGRSLAKEAPLLEPDQTTVNPLGRTMREDTAGISRPGAFLGYFKYDAGAVLGATAVRYEISKPDAWFEHYTGTLRDKSPSERTSMAGILDKVRSERSSIDLAHLKAPGFYELRLFPLDRSGKTIGYASDPLNFQLSKADFKRRRRDAP